MHKNQKSKQVSDPWYIPAVPTCKSDFDAPDCPVRALRYYHRYITEYPEWRKDNNSGKEPSAADISRWICTTIGDSHSTLRKSKSIPGTVKAHKVRSEATLLKFFNKVDLQAV